MASIGTLNIDFQTNVATLINDMRRASAAVERSSTSMDRSLRSAATSLKSFIAGYATIESVRSIVKISDDFTRLEGRLKNATRDSFEFNSAYAGLKETAKQTGTAIETSLDVFQRISLIRDDLGATNAEMLKFTDTASKLGALSGAGLEAQKAGLTQLAQGLSSGVLRAEEFNSIMENIPAVGKAIADELGVSTGQLRQMVIDGKVLSKDVFEAILASADETNEKFSKMGSTFERAGNAFNIEFRELIGNITESTGAVDGLVLAINGATTATQNLNNKWGYLLSILTTAQINNFSALSGIEIDTQKFDPKFQAIKKAKEDIAQADVLLARLKGRVDEIGFTGRGTFLGSQISNEDALALGGETIQAPRPGKKPEVPAFFESSLKKTYSAAAKEAQKHADAIKSVIENLKFENEQLGRSAEQQELYNALKQAGVTADSEAGQAIAALVGEHQRLEEAQKRGTALQEELVKRGSQAIEQHKRSFESFNSVVEQGLRGQIKSWKDLGIAILSEVQNIIAAQYQLQAGNPSSPIGGFLSQIFGFGGPKLSQSAIDLATFGNGRLFARGGISNRPAIFGEAGPEAAVPLPDGRSIPVKFNNGGRSGNTYYMDVRGADAAAIARLEARLIAMDGSVERRALSAVRNENSRNPRFLR